MQWYTPVSQSWRSGDKKIMSSRQAWRVYIKTLFQSNKRQKYFDILITLQERNTHYPQCVVEKLKQRNIKWLHKTVLCLLHILRLFIIFIIYMSQLKYLTIHVWSYYSLCFYYSPFGLYGIKSYMLKMTMRNKILSSIRHMTKLYQHLLFNLHNSLSSSY